VELGNIIEDLKTLWHTLGLGGSLPQWLITVVIILAAIRALLALIAEIDEKIKPLFYDAEKKRRARRRRIFAEHVAAEIRQIDLNADWSEDRFAELEAEVEAEGTRRRRFLPWRRRSSLRREKSLSSALRSSEERLILLEGEPGAGKSVALRHLAHVMAEEAKKSRSTKSIIPLYINMKTIERPIDVAVDVDLIRAHVLKTLNRPNSRDVEEFLNDEFARGIEEGTWLFLFDSFDEIPDVLSATSADTSIREYGQAISDFLSAMNACRGIIASRYFRGPGALGWPKFRILVLGDEYRRRLIKRADLPKAIESELIGQLELAGPELALNSRNPMFLGLLCQHMRKEKTFPENAHVVFEDYVETRLTRDQEKLMRRFNVGAVEVREAAEQAAFCMAYHPTLGLSPARTALAAAMAERGYEGKASTMFDALEFIKLARAEGDANDPTFTFAHRRFQEYFATSVVLDAPDIVTPEKLLTDARWRETAVVMLQTQRGERLERIVAKAEELLQRELDAIPDPGGAYSGVREFPWPPLTLHLLSLIQSGYQGRASTAPDRLRFLVGEIVRLATMTGSLSDRKWALEVAGISPEPVLVEAIRKAFAGGSLLLADVAYKQAALLGDVPEDIAKPIRAALVKSFANGRLFREREATLAHVRRLPRKQRFRDMVNLLLAIWPIDFALHAIVALLIMATMQQKRDFLLLVGFVLVSALGTRAIVRGGARFNLPFAVMAFLVLFVRMMPAIVAFAAVGTGVGVITVALLIWAPFALHAASKGWFVRPGWWAAYFLYPLLFIAGAIRSLFAMNWAIKRSQWVGALMLVAVLALTGALIKNPYHWRVIDWIGYAFGGLMLTLLAVALVYTLYNDIRNRLHDQRLWHRRVRGIDKFASAHDFANVFVNLKRAESRSNLIQLVRERAMIDVTPENERVIRQLAIAFENAPKSPFEDQARISVRLLDELNIIAEQMRLRLAG